MNGTPPFQACRPPASRRGHHAFWPAVFWWPHIPQTTGFQAEDVVPNSAHSYRAARGGLRADGEMLQSISGDQPSAGTVPEAL